MRERCAGGVVGLDLSLRCSAAVYVPSAWEVGAWEELACTTCGTPVPTMGKGDQLRCISDHLVNFVRRTRPAVVAVEDYAYGLAGNAGMWLAELGGAVKAHLARELGVECSVVNQTTARTFFLGKLPRSTKALKLPRGAVPLAVHNALRAMGWPYGADCGDALLVATYARTEQGLPGLVAHSGDKT